MRVDMSAEDGQELVCIECGTGLLYFGAGRYPKYCSQTCRSRAWEKRRAAELGLVSGEVVDRTIEVPRKVSADDVVAWLNGHPKRLHRILTRLDADPDMNNVLARFVNTNVPDVTVIPDGQWDQYRHQLDYLRKRLREFSPAETRFDASQRDHDWDDDRHSRPDRESPPVDRSADLAPLEADGGCADVEDEPVYVAAKTIVVGGKRFKVPVSWTRQQARAWCRDHPECGT